MRHGNHRRGRRWLYAALLILAVLAAVAAARLVGAYRSAYDDGTHGPLPPQWTPVIGSGAVLTGQPITLPAATVPAPATTAAPARTHRPAPSARPSPAATASARPAPTVTTWTTVTPTVTTWTTVTVPPSPAAYGVAPPGG